MADGPVNMPMLARRMGVIVLAAMVAMLGAAELQRRTHVKTKGVSPSKVSELFHGDIDFTKLNLKEQADARAALKRDNASRSGTSGSGESAKQTLRAWVNELLKPNSESSE